MVSGRRWAPHSYLPVRQAPGPAPAPAAQGPSVAATTATKANASWCCATKPCATNSTRVGKRTAQIVAQGSIAAVLSEAKHAMDTAVRSTHSAQQRNELQQPAV